MLSDNKVKHSGDTPGDHLVLGGQDDDCPQMCGEWFSSLYVLSLSSSHTVPEYFLFLAGLLFAYVLKGGSNCILSLSTGPDPGWLVNLCCPDQLV